MKVQLLIICLALLACSEPQVSGGEITVRNDILDKEYNAFVVYDVVTDKGSTGYRHKFSPGDEVALPFKHVREFQVSRQYADHANVYVVKCPEDFSSKITVKLIDIHTNKLSGGCKLTKRGERGVGGYVKWE